jgi:hypothetical protein
MPARCGSASRPQIHPASAKEITLTKELTEEVIKQEAEKIKAKEIKSVNAQSVL